MEEFSALVDLAVGRRLCAVRLVGPTIGASVDDSREVAGVELDLEGVFLRFNWRLDGVDERLTFECGSEPELQGGVTSHVSGAWHGLLGDAISGVRVSTHMSDESLPPSTWAVTFESRGERSVTIALGELDEQDVPTYMPDSIVLIFGRVEAESFRPPAAIASAWGTKVCELG